MADVPPAVSALMGFTSEFAGVFVSLCRMARMLVLTERDPATTAPCLARIHALQAIIHVALDRAQTSIGLDDEDYDGIVPTIGETFNANAATEALQTLMRLPIDIRVHNLQLLATQGIARLGTMIVYIDECRRQFPPPAPPSLAPAPDTDIVPLGV